MSERRERELVLAPNEYAYVLDTTKGHVNCYVGPNKTSLAQTDQPVRFDPASKRFEPVDLDHAVALFATAPENWYVVLKNPARDNVHPSPGVASSLVELRVGRKVVVPGPTAFPLWPGQMARVIRGHRLRANEYLYVRVYDAEAAGERWHQALGQAAPTEPPTFTSGEKRIIKGSDVRFYMPPTGVEVVPDRHGRFVREAITLERLEYAILEGEDGRRRYVRGEAVVFPGPEERPVVRDGRNKHRAIELSRTTGLHVKVVAPYTDADGAAHTEGEELFLTGEGVIYFPREEHQIVRQGGRTVHQAVAVPRGQGRYLLDRQSGEVSLLRGPQMLLPDPREQVLVRRVLTDRACRLMYPGNGEALGHNRALRSGAPPNAVPKGKPARRPDDPGWVGPRAITLDNRFDGAVRVEVWAGYAVQVVDEAGGRRVVQGPATELLAYHEHLQPLRLSTGTPKADAERLDTVYLQVRGNRVSDRIQVVTRDLVQAQLSVVYRVEFAGDDPNAWFTVEDYVKLLCDHTRSRLKAGARGLSVRDLQADVTPLVRDLLLGEPAGPGQPRPGLRFAENGLRIYDVEVLAFEIADDAVRDLLAQAQQAAVAGAVQVAERTEGLTHALKLAQVEQALAQAEAETAQIRQALAAQQAAEADRVRAEAHARAVALRQAEDAAALAQAERAAEIEAQRLAARAARTEQDVAARRAQQTVDLERLQAQAQAAVQAAKAFDPHLVQALNRLGDEQLLAALAENFGELAAVEGRGLLATAQRFLDFVPASLLPQLSAGAPAEPPAS